MLQKGHLSYFKNVTVLTHFLTGFFQRDSIFYFITWLDAQWRLDPPPANFIETNDYRRFVAEL